MPLSNVNEKVGQNTKKSGIFGQKVRHSHVWRQNIFISPIEIHIVATTLCHNDVTIVL